MRANIESPVSLAPAPLPASWLACTQGAACHLGTSGMTEELAACWAALQALNEAINRGTNPSSWAHALSQTVACLHRIRGAHQAAAVLPEDQGFAGRFQLHFEFETLGLESVAGEFLFCDPPTILVHGACAVLEKRISSMGRAIALEQRAGDIAGLRREVRARGYGVRRALEQVVVLVLEQLPLEMSSRAMVPGFRSTLKDLLNWLEVLSALECEPSEQRVQQAFDALSQSEAAGALSGQEFLEVEKYQSLRADSMTGLQVALAGRPMVEEALARMS